MPYYTSTTDTRASNSTTGQEHTSSSNSSRAHFEGISSASAGRGSATNVQNTTIITSSGTERLEKEQLPPRLLQDVFEHNELDRLAGLFVRRPSVVGLRKPAPSQRPRRRLKPDRPLPALRAYPIPAVERLNLVHS